MWPEEHTVQPNKVLPAINSHQNTVQYIDYLIFFNRANAIYNQEIAGALLSHHFTNTVTEFVHGPTLPTD
jgi:hypothetical protein